MPLVGADLMEHSYDTIETPVTPVFIAALFTTSKMPYN
jgi:hypothetical protein